MIEKEPIDTNEESDPTNWRNWYLSLIVFLLAQIVFYFIITNSYQV